MRDSLADTDPVEYKTKTGKKKLYACQLSNGMTVCVTAPTREIYRMSATVLSYSILAALILLVVTFIVMFFKRIKQGGGKAEIARHKFLRILRTIYAG